MLIIGAVAGCGGTPRPATSAAPLPSGATTSASASCYVADSTAPTADTLYSVGLGPNSAAMWMLDCTGRRPLPERPLATVVDWPPPPGTDLRDVLDRGIATQGDRKPDVVVTRDPDVIAYAASRPDYFVAPLVFDRTYVLLAAAVDTTSPIPTDAERDALAQDAVTSDARGAVAPFTWFTDSACVAAMTPAPASPRPVVGYAANDPIARQLAERIVALASSRDRPAWMPTTITPTVGASLRVAPIVPDSIPAALATGRVSGAVAPLSRDPRWHCLTHDTTLAPRHGIPLVDSRAHVIVRRGSGAAFYVGVDGSLWFTRRPGR